MFANKFGRFNRCDCGLVASVKRRSDDVVVPVPLTSSKVDLTIFDVFAEVRVTQVYANCEESPIEAEYIFPLDDKAVVYEFEAEIEGRRVVGKVREKADAKREYQDAVRRGRTAAILEKKKPDVFKAAVGCLKPGAKAVVKISYITELSVDGDFLRFVLPTTVAPRYVPASDKTEASQELASMPHSDSSPCQMLIKGSVVSKTKVVELSSPSHKIDTNLSLPAEPGATGAGMHRATVELSGIVTDMDRDFILLVKVEEPHAPRVFVEESEDSITAMLTLVPSFKLPNEKVEIVFLIDRSGSMEGPKVKMASNALKLFLTSLPSDCYFNVVGFGSDYRPLFSGGSAKYDAKSLARATNYVGELEADMGGTEMVAPLKRIYSMEKRDGHKRQVIVLTDGEVGNVDDVLELVRENNKESRTFALGIGNDVSQGLVTGIARMGRGTSLFCSLDERLETKVQQQLTNCLQPALEDVEIKWGSMSGAIGDAQKAASDANVEKSRTLLGYGKPTKSSEQRVDPAGIFKAPHQVPPIFDGARFTQFCSFPKALLTSADEGLEKVLGPVVVKAMAPDGPLEVALEINPSDVVKGCSIHRLAAKKRIEDLEEGVGDLHERFLHSVTNRTLEEPYDLDACVKSSLVAVSTKYNIVCRETAFVAVDTATGNGDETAEISVVKRKITNQIPHGFGGYVGGYGVASASFGLQNADDDVRLLLLNEPLPECGPLTVGFGSRRLRGGDGSSPLIVGCASTPLSAGGSRENLRPPRRGSDMRARGRGSSQERDRCRSPVRRPAGLPRRATLAYGGITKGRRADSGVRVEDLLSSSSDVEYEEMDEEDYCGSSAVVGSSSSGEDSMMATDGSSEHQRESGVEEDEQQEEKLRKLVELQEYDGCFPLSQGLAELLGTTLPALTEAAAGLQLAKSAWATALAIAFMQLALGDLQEDWALMLNKAKVCLLKMVSLDSDGLVAAAIGHVKDLLKL